MSEDEFMAWLQCAVEEMPQTPTDFREALTEIQSFGESGLLTQDVGLVLTFADGSEFEVTIVQSQEGQS